VSARVAIITGANRGSGIGAAIERELAADGWSLLLTGWPSYDAEQKLSRANDSAWLEELRGMGTCFETLECDLAEPASPTRVLEAAARLGPVSGLVNNATHSEHTHLAAPMGRVGLPTDAARLVRFLMSEDAGWITGQVIRSRGGV
jgi:NAD(P)-dependent dehydrogenase (short-subunit alcohol dehydrogenase family)